MGSASGSRPESALPPHRGHVPVVGLLELCLFSGDGPEQEDFAHGDQT